MEKLLNAGEDELENWQTENVVDWARKNFSEEAASSLKGRIFQLYIPCM